MAELEKLQLELQEAVRESEKLKVRRPHARSPSIGLSHNPQSTRSPPIGLILVSSIVDLKTLQGLLC